MKAKDSTSKDGWSWADTIFLSLLLLTAAVLRFWSYDTLGIDHYDEGGYAMSAMAVYEWRSDLMYPLQYLLSPPLFFTLAGLGMHLLNAPADLALFIVSSVAGTLTACIIYIIGRNNYGREAGLAAGLLVSLADFHISFSRAGLTDITFCFIFLSALLAYIKAERLESFSWAIIAGILTGLAWNTKYHGWLAGVIAGIALLPYLLRNDWKRFRAGFSRILTAAAIATAMYAPWFLHIEAQEGGYAYMAEYQSGFLEPSNALQNIISHVRAQHYLDGWSGMLAPVLGIIAVATLYRRLNTKAITLGLALLLGGIALGESITVAVLALVGIATLLRDNPSYGQLVLIAFFLVFSLLTPLYHPYMRLLLPFMCSAYILAGIGLASLVQNKVPFIQSFSSKHQLLLFGSAIPLLALLIFFKGSAERGHTYLPSTGFISAVEEVMPLIPKDMDVAVIGEPAAVFYLRSGGHNAAHLNVPEDIYNYFETGQPVYIACGRYACHLLKDWLAQSSATFTKTGTGTVNEISTIRLSDDESPWSVAKWDRNKRRDYDLQLFRLNSIPSPQPDSSPPRF